MREFRRLGCGALKVQLGDGFSRSLPGDESLQVIAERAKRSETLFIKQPLGAAAQAYLIRMTLHPYRPAHFAMPTAPEQKQSETRKSGCGEADRPQPIRFAPLVWTLTRI